MKNFWFITWFPEEFLNTYSGTFPGLLVGSYLNFNGNPFFFFSIISNLSNLSSLIVLPIQSNLNSWKGELSITVILWEVKYWSLALLKFKNKFK